MLRSLAGITAGLLHRVNILTQALLPWDGTLTADQKAKICDDLKAELASADRLKEKAERLAK